MSILRSIMDALVDKEGIARYVAQVELPEWLFTDLAYLGVQPIYVITALLLLVLTAILSCACRRRGDSLKARTMVAKDEAIDSEAEAKKARDDAEALKAAAEKKKRDAEQAASAANESVARAAAKASAAASKKAIADAHEAALTAEEKMQRAKQITEEMATRVQAAKDEYMKCLGVQLIMDKYHARCETAYDEAKTSLDAISAGGAQGAAPAG